MNIYTKTGDKGETSLFGGKRVLKYNPRIDAYGTIDELNSFIGLLYSEDKSDKKIELNNIQNLLFKIGSELATPQESLYSKNGESKIGPMVEVIDIQSIENYIDNMELILPKLNNFILPTGNKLSSLSHICRTITRRAERKVVELSSQEPVRELIIIFLNRLSDYFFVLARYFNYIDNREDLIWKNK